MFDYLLFIQVVMLFCCYVLQLLLFFVWLMPMSVVCWIGVSCFACSGCFILLIGVWFCVLCGLCCVFCFISFELCVLLT